MSIQVTLPSKKVVDIRPFLVDLTQWLEEGEALSSVTVSVVMYTGDDPNPSDILYLPAEITGNVVHQRIRAGIPGNIYIVTMDVLSDQDRHFIIDAYQAVLPNGVPAEDLYLPFYFTSRPYPLETLESTTFASSVRSGYLVMYDIGEVNLAYSIITAELYANLETYDNWPWEGVDFAFSLESGTLVVVLVTYEEWPWEGVNFAVSIQAGALVNQLVTYPNWPWEGVNFAFGVQSGSLV